MGKILRNNYINTLLSGILLAGVALVIIPSEYLLIKWGANHAVKLLLGYLALALFFLLFNQKRLMFISFLCTAILAIFLKTMTNSEMKPPEAVKDMPIFKLAHFNVNNANEDFSETIDIILSTEADLISVQETTPYWDKILHEGLSSNYPHSFTHPDLGLFGMTVFSRKPFAYIDTVRYEEIPNIIGGLNLDEDNTIHFVGSHLLPALNYNYYERLTGHLDFIAEYCNQNEKPIITFGDYHTVPWSNEIADFRNATELQDSRRGFTPTFPHGGTTVFEVPIDHFFFSNDMECLSFSAVSTLYTNHLGIQASFQLKSEDAEKEN